MRCLECCDVSFPYANPLVKFSACVSVESESVYFCDCIVPSIVTNVTRPTNIGERLRVVRMYYVCMRVQQRC